MLVLAVPGMAGGRSRRPEREDRPPLFVLRCTIPAYWLDRMERGTDQRGLGRGPSHSWWSRGALVVDEAGPALIDADRQRVPIPVPATGGRLVRLAVAGNPPPQRPSLLAAVRQPRSSGRAGGRAGPPGQNAMPVIYLNFICGPSGQVTARLPGDEEGFSADGLAAFAAAAGLAFERSTQAGLERYCGLRASVDLRACADDAAYRASRGARIKRMLHLQGRCSPYEEPYRSRYPVTTPPYRLPGG